MWKNKRVTREEIDKLNSEIKRLQKALVGVSKATVEVKKSNMGISKLIVLAVVAIPIFTTIANQISREILQKGDIIIEQRAE